MIFGYVEPPFGEWWGDVKQLLDKAVTKGGNDWLEVEDGLNKGWAQLWLTVEGGPINATVTRTENGTVEIWLCGGRVLPDALHFLETILGAAKAGGMTTARIVGRKGWARVLAPYGWRVAGDELVKDLA